jgi:histidyl-tRNA synthetase
MKFKPLKGMRDLLPEEMIVRQQILNKIKCIFETFGFQPLETPAIESWEVLAAKGAGGEEILKETYNFEDKDGRKIGLRYDLTVPLARVIATKPNLTLPFKRYQIQNVWRYGDVAKGRLREFLQADIDIVGSESMLADAEVISCAVAGFTALGFKDFVVRLNNRKLLSALVKYAGVEESKVLNVLRTIDKLDKIGIKGVEEELKKIVPETSVKGIIEFINIKGGNTEVLKEAEKLVGNLKEGKEGLKELKQLISYLEKMGVQQSFIKVDLSLARGLDYYTGPIFEVTVGERIGSLAGGGRYDKMIGLFLGRDIPATGISLGIERIIEVMKMRKMVEIKKSNVKVFVASVDENVIDATLKIVQTLRSNGINTDFDLRGRTLTKQLEYADSIKIPYVVIIGKEEIEKGLIRLRDMEKRVEKELNLNELIKFLKSSS